MTTFAPLPSWAGMAAGLFGAERDSAELAAAWVTGDAAVSWFARSAWALQAIGADWRGRHGGRPPVVWFPGYFCNQSTEPLRRTGARLVFYPIGDDLEPDWAACRDLADAAAPPDIFVLVHYFGHAADGAAARAFCDTVGACLLEDAAHVLVPEAGIGAFGRYVFYSPHKVLPVHDGALLVDSAPDGGTTPRAEPGAAAPGAGAWLLTRAVLKTAPAWLRRHRIRGLPGFDDDPPFAPLPTAPAPSRVGRRLLSAMATDIPAIAAARKRNARAWREALATALPAARPLFTPAAEGAAPYRFVLKFPDRNSAHACFATARRAGIPVETWPDLAPEVSADPDRHGAALRFRETLLFWPVHAAPPALPGF